MEKFFTERERIEFLILKASKKTKPTQRSTAIALLSEAIERIKSLPDSRSRTYCLIDISKTCRDLDLKDLSLEVLAQALELVETYEDDNLKAMNLNDIGYQYINLDQTNRGFELLETAFQLATNLEDVDERDLILCDIAGNYGDLGRIDMTLKIARLIQDPYRVEFRVLKPLQIDPESFFSRDNF